MSLDYDDVGTPIHLQVGEAEVLDEKETNDDIVDDVEVDWEAIERV